MNTQHEKIMKEGVFWVIPREAEQYGFEIISEFNGILGHSNIWETVICKNKKLAQYEYDFFPRGRVWVKDGKATIFLNRKINVSNIISQLNLLFCLNGNFDIQLDN